MLRFLFLLTVVACGAHTVAAQSIGDSTQAVETALGRPQMTRSTSNGDVWIYASGVRVTFKAGVVAAVEGLAEVEPVAPQAPATTRKAVVTVVRETKPPPASSSVESDPLPEEPRSIESPSPSHEPAPAIRPWKLGGVILGFVGFAVVSLVCQVLILIEAFKTSIWWGLGSLFVPFVVLLFIATNWSNVKKPFLVNLGSAGALGVYLSLFVR